jgi:hypothetical protein
MPTELEIAGLNEQYFKKADVDNSGTIEKEEFRTWFLSDLDVHVLLQEFKGKKPQEVRSLVMIHVLYGD